VSSDTDIELVKSILLFQIDNVLASDGSVVAGWYLFRLVRNLDLKLGLFPA
jgi:hypothetical protein